MNIRRFTIAILATLITFPAFAETVDEALQRLTTLAEINRPKLLIYAATSEALRRGDGQLVKMPSSVLKKGQEIAGGYWGSFIDLNGSTVSVQGHGSFVSFDISATVSWRIDEDSSGHKGESDPIKAKVQYIRLMQTDGIIFRKTGERIQSSPIGKMGCMGMNMLLFCLDKNFHDKTSFVRMMRNRQAEADFLVTLIAKKGQNGILSRNAVSQWYEEAQEEVNGLLLSANDGEGAIVPMEKGGFKLVQ